MIRTAVIDESGLYRYSLTREWSGLRRMAWIMLNASKADANIDDPTIRRCIGFSNSWGYGGIIVVNLFAYRATDPKELLKVDDPIGSDNDYYIRQAVINAELIVAAWGAHRMAELRGAEVKLLVRLETIEILRCLGKTKSGAPKHPLYIPSDTRLEKF